jgi:hypothetical protein
MTMATAESDTASTSSETHDKTPTETHNTTVSGEGSTAPEQGTQASETKPTTNPLDSLPHLDGLTGLDGATHDDSTGTNREESATPSPMNMNADTNTGTENNGGSETPSTSTGNAPGTGFSSDSITNSILSSDPSTSNTTNTSVTSDTAETATQTSSGSDSTSTTTTAQPEADPVAVVSASPSAEPATPAAPAAEPEASATTPAAEAVAAAPGTGEALAEEVPAVQAKTVEPVPPVVELVSYYSSPLPDVITAVQHLLTSIAATGAALLQMPSDLASLLGFPGMTAGSVAPVVPGGIGQSLTVPAAPTVAPKSALAPHATEWTDILFALGTPHTLSGTVGEQSLLGHFPMPATDQGTSASGVAPVVHNAVASPDVGSILEHTVDAVLAPASLTLLALIALPGIAGLLVISGTGTAVGYRQAKAASVLRAVGIGRFVKHGPLGVVRSGSLVALHHRAPRHSAPERSRTNFLETVA